MQLATFALPLILASATAYAQQTVRPDGMGGWVIQDQGGCGGLFGAAQGECVANQQRSMQQQYQLQLLQQQQIMLQQQQLENQRLENERLRRQSQQDLRPVQAPSQKPSLVDYSQTPEFRNWQLKNPWFGADRAKTEFALLYAKQLRQERPDLIGGPFFDAVSAKVEETFGAPK